MTNDRKNLLIILSYCLFFVILRLVIPHSFSHDEAEQIINSKEYLLGFPQQAPLYSWILKSISFLIPINLYSLTLIKYFFYFGFLTSIYLITRIFYEENFSLLITASNLFFISYIYDFNRDLTHSVLVTTFAALSYLWFIKLLIQRSFVNYLIFGILLALGFLSKYNFALVILVLLLTSLSNKLGRRVLFNLKTLISIVIFGLISFPHLVWLYKAKFSGLAYALSRAETEKTFSLSSSLFTLLAGYYEVILVFIVLTLIWFRNFQKTRKKTYTHKNLINSGFYSLIIPIVLLISFGFNSFYAKWLSPIYFILVLNFFILFNINFKKENYSRNSKITFILITIFILVNCFITLIGGLYPGLVGSIRTTQYPYDSVSRQLCADLSKYNLNHIEIIIDKNHLLLGNLIATLPKYLSQVEINDSIKNKNKEIKIFLWDMRNSKRYIDVLSYCPQAQKPIIYKAKYINGTKLKDEYRMAASICDLRNNQE